MLLWPPTFGLTVKFFICTRREFHTFDRLPLADNKRFDKLQFYDPIAEFFLYEGNLQDEVQNA